MHLTRVEALARRRLERGALFLPPLRLALRTLACAAHAAHSPGRDAARGLDAFLEQALVELLDDQLAEERRGVAPHPLEAPFYAEAALRLGVPGRFGRLACTALNRLPAECRRTVFDLPCLDDAGDGRARRPRTALHGARARAAIARALATPSAGDG